MDAQFVHLAGFYENELTNRFLRFWLPRCEDKTNGGFFNCFDNEGRQLLSRDKYTWSQGRFVWIFAKLASIKAPVFDRGQRAEFLRLAGQGAEFLMKNCLIAPDDWRCVFLMDESGAPKQVEGYTQLDMSLYADCFVIAGLALYSVQAKDRRVYSFCRRLYESACDRLEKGNYNTLPYPLSEDLRAHGLPMIFSNISQEMYAAACVFEPEFAVRAMKRVEMYTRDVLENFVDENNCIHEVIRSDNTFFCSFWEVILIPGTPSRMSGLCWMQHACAASLSGTRSCAISQPGAFVRAGMKNLAGCCISVLSQGESRREIIPGLKSSQCPGSWLAGATSSGGFIPRHCTPACAAIF